MEVILRMVFIAFVAITGMVLNHEITTKAQSLHYLKEDLEIAAHDAALEIKSAELASGRIVFDQEKAMTTFRNSFEKNSFLSSSDYEIIEAHFFDETTVSSFPHTFEATNVVFSDEIQSPSIVAFVKTKKNAYYSNNSSENFIQIASYTYKPEAGASVSTMSMATVSSVNTFIGEPGAHGLVWPVPHTRNITSDFGMRFHPKKKENLLHDGIDIASPGVYNTPVVSALDGKVIFAGWIDGYGNVVLISHGNGLETRYAHLETIQTVNDESVKAGQIIGTVGSTGLSTGPHLHYEVRVNGEPKEPQSFY